VCYDLHTSVRAVRGAHTAHTFRHEKERSEQNMDIQKIEKTKNEDIMAKDLITATLDDTIQEVVLKMDGANIGAVIVNDHQGNCQGIFTERDLLKKVVAQGVAIDSKIAEVITQNPTTVSPGDTVLSTYLIMKREHFRHLPVTCDGKTVGIISMRDMNSIIWGSIC